MQMVLTNNFYSWARTVLLGNEINHFIQATNVNSGNGDSLYYHQVMGDLISVNGTKVSQFLVQHAYNDCGENSNSVSLGYFNNVSVPGYDYTYFKIGANNEATTEEMTELKSLISENYSISITGTHTDRVLTFTLIIGNTGEEELSIGEIGLYKDFSGNTASTVLLGRCAFEVPIIIFPNKTKTFEITVEI